ncbi:MAG TPA: ABC transporter permease [Magnetospirillaceae bacterium]|nr:ABC transporter permease [Magnetospirillaceae bacterium]
MRNYGPIYAGPAGIWLTLFFVAPLMIIVVYSFMEKGLHGGVEPRFSLEAYRSLATSVFLRVSLNTLGIALATTVMAILIALPCGYYMARSRHKTLLLMLVIIPFWTNFLIRIYAWIAILGNAGFLNTFLINVGIVTDPVQFLYNHAAVAVVLVYTYLPYAILPLYSTIEKFDFTLLEAARDLGCSRRGAIFRVLLPNIRPGIITAILFVFIPTFGAFAVPLLVGGKDSYMLGNFVADELTKSRNWPLASAISIVITLVTTAGLWLMFRLQGKSPLAGRPSQADIEREAP